MKARMYARIQWITLAVLLPCLILNLPEVRSLRIRENSTSPIHRTDGPRYLVDTGGVPLQFIRQSVNSNSKNYNSRVGGGVNGGGGVQNFPQAQYYTTENPTGLLLQYFVKSQDYKPKAKTVTLANSTPEPEYTSLVEDDPGSGVRSVGGASEESPETSYEDYLSSEETTTIKVPIIPPALRRNFARLVDTPTTEIESGPFTSLDGLTDIVLPEKSSRKKNKNKSNPRRRKIKRPSKDRTSTSTTEAAAQVADPDAGGAAETPDKDADGDKNLAVEISSPDGKYALINTFFNNSDPQRPGIISYASSESFPKQDNVKTLGNLQESDIWLADGHLLVIKGGDFDNDNKEVWPPIDNYQRKRKPVLRIPLDSDNPPPFPVFVNKSGPPVFLREPPPFLPYPPPGFFGNDSNFDPSAFAPPGMVALNPNGTLPRLPFPPPGGPGFGRPIRPGGGGGPFGRPPPQPGGVNGGGGGLYGNKLPGGGGVYGAAPPGGFNVFNGSNPPLPPYPFEPPPGGFNGRFPPGPGFNNSQRLPPNFLPPPPGFNPNFNGSNGGGPSFPPFAPPLVLNPADNETDDPSIFLPPPYDFDYYEDNSTLVPPGPFAPGLVVPPPKDFYTVFNRTGRPPVYSYTTPRPYYPTSTGIPTTVEAVVTNPVGGSTKKQRPNGKKPKFPMTNPPDDSEEELYHIPLVTTPIPHVPIVTITTKKRKQRPKKPFFPQDSTSDYSSEEDEKARILPPSLSTKSPPGGAVIFPTYNSVPVYSSSPSPNEITAAPPTYQVIIQSSPRPISISTTTPSTPRPVINSFVYVQGRLTSLEEIAAQEAEKTNPNQPHTPAPPFDARGYPTRVLEDEDPPVFLEYQPKKVESPRNRKPTESPVKTYHTGTPKYDPNYVPNYSSNGNKQPSPNIQFGPTPVVYQQVYPSRPSHTQQNHHQQQQQPQGPIYIQNLPQPPARQQPIYTQQNYHQQQQPIGPSGPTYTLQSEEPRDQQYHQEQPPQRAPKRKRPKTRLRINQSPGNPSNSNQEDPDVNAPIYNPQVTSGFRPAYPPPQQQPSPTPSRSYDENENNGRGNGGRFLFPGQQPQQQLAPINQQFYNNLNAINGGAKPLQNFSPQGYYSPVTNYYQPGAPTYNRQPFVPSQPFPTAQTATQNRHHNHNQQQSFNPYSLPVTEPYPTADPTHSPVGYNHLLSGLNVNPFRQLFPQFGAQGQQQSQEQQHHTQQSPQQIYANNPGNSQRIIQQQQPHNNFGNTPQNLGGRYNQYSQLQPLYDDVRVNYREPIPLYNTESEAIVPRAAVKAGPSSPSEKVSAAGSSPTGTFYSFQRGGPGGFSYKIRL